MLGREGSNPCFLHDVRLLSHIWRPIWRTHKMMPCNVQWCSQSTNTALFFPDVCFCSCLPLSACVFNVVVLFVCVCVCVCVFVCVLLCRSLQRGSPLVGQWKSLSYFFRHKNEFSYLQMNVKSSDRRADWPQDSSGHVCYRMALLWVFSMLCCPSTPTGIVSDCSTARQLTHEATTFRGNYRITLSWPLKTADLLNSGLALHIMTFYLQSLVKRSGVNIEWFILKINWIF